MFKKLLLTEFINSSLKILTFNAFKNLKFLNYEKIPFSSELNKY